MLSSLLNSVPRSHPAMAATRSQTDPYRSVQSVLACHTLVTISTYIDVANTYLGYGLDTARTRMAHLVVSRHSLCSAGLASPCACYIGFLAIHTVIHMATVTICETQLLMIASERTRSDLRASKYSKGACPWIPIVRAAFICSHTHTDLVCRLALISENIFLCPS